MTTTAPQQTGIKDLDDLDVLDRDRVLAGHRAKTARRWRYLRNKDGTYTWHGPHGQTYLVTPLGTTELPDA
jgi:hypothetical protein